MIIDCISDLHGYYPKLEGGDLLIVAGDLTARDKTEEYMDFHEWVRKQKYNKTILIAGNHDNKIQSGFFNLDMEMNFTEKWLGFEYLCDSGTEFEGLKIWGSSWTKTFKGMNPHCKAFTVDTEEELAAKWALISSDIDILITHSPPYGILDGVPDFYTGKVIWTGSSSLRQEVTTRIKPRLHVFGHIHENGGNMVDLITTKFINASHVNEFYKPVNKPVRVIL